LTNESDVRPNRALVKHDKVPLPTPGLAGPLLPLGRVLAAPALSPRASSLLMESLADSSGAKFLIPFRRCFDGGTVMGRAYSQDLRKRQFSPSPKRPFATLLHERLMHSSKPSLKRSQTSHPASAQIISQTRAMAANHENALGTHAPPSRCRSTRQIRTMQKDWLRLFAPGGTGLFMSSRSTATARMLFSMQGPNSSA
jgi:hypothetical protein